MEEKIERLKQSIELNPNLSKDLKQSITSLATTLVSVYPDYDYSTLTDKLSNLIINVKESDNYFSYDEQANTLGYNTTKILNDGIDLQHLFLDNMLEMNSKVNFGYEAFKTGITEIISSTINEDTSMKKLNVREFLLASTFTKIVDPQIILNSYMSGSMVDIIMALDTIGVNKEEFDSLCASFSKLNDPSKNNTSFSDAEIQMIEMYNKKIAFGIQNGVYSFDDISPLYKNFEGTLISNRSELISLYPRHDFSNMTGFERVAPALENAIVNTEIIEVEERVK